MAHFIPRPMNIQLSSDNDSVSSPRVKDLIAEDVKLHDMRDSFPTNNLNLDAIIVYPKETHYGYSHLPEWLNGISELYMCNILSIIENQTQKIYTVVTTHRMWTNIEHCCEAFSEFSDELFEQHGILC